MHKISPFLWFNTQAEEAARFYVSIFPNSKVLHVTRAGDQVMYASFELDGQFVQALNGGPQFTFNEAFSFFVNCETQEEVDTYWTKLIADGGSEGQCGWLKDKFGLSWQIVPTALGRLLGDPNREKADRAMKAMLAMKKIVIEELEQAFDGHGTGHDSSQK